jgi:hypothetical protein
MTFKSLWIILIRILGIYLAFQLFILIEQIFTQLVFLSHLPTGSNQPGILTEISMLITIIVVMLLLIRFCLYNPIRIIDMLHLDEGFNEEQITVNGDRLKILNVAVIVIGGVILADALPLLLKTTFIYFQHINTYRLFKDFPDSAWIVFYAAKCIIGYLTMSFSRSISLFIDRRTDKPIELE